MWGRVKFLFLYTFLLSILICKAQETSIPQPFATIDTSVLTIGDQTKMHLSINVPLFTKVRFPDLKDTIIGKIEIVEKSKIDTLLSEDKNSYTLSQHYTITSFDSGYYPIPPIKFFVNNDSVFTEAFLLQVNNVPVDTTQAIKDIKSPLDLPLTFREIAPYLGGALVLAAIIYGIYYYWKKRRKLPTAVVEEKKIVIPAHIIAIQELQALQAEKLWQQGMVKEYHIRVTDIIRAYIEKRFDVFALEQTTDEITRGMRTVPIDEQLKSKLKQLLILSDLVKFAKEQPLPAENESSIVIAFEFVNSTIPIVREDENGKEETKL